MLNVLDHSATVDIYFISLDLLVSAYLWTLKSTRWAADLPDDPLNNVIE